MIGKVVDWLSPSCTYMQAGVSLMFRGVTIPNDSFVDVDDVLSIAGGISPSNTNPINGTLLCVTATLKTVVRHHVQCVVIGTFLMGVELYLVGVMQHFKQTEVQMKK